MKVSKNLRKIFLFLMLFNLFKLSYSYVNIYPVRFDKSIDRDSGDETYVLHNSTGKRVRYRVYVDKVKDDRKDMSEWVDYYPKSITLKPGESQNIKVEIKAPKGTEEGEYLAVLGVKEIALPNEGSPNDDILNIFTDLKLEIAGFVGDIKPKLNTLGIGLKIDDEGNLYPEGVVQNIGDRRGNFEFYMINSKGKERYLLGERRLLKEREIDLVDIGLKIIDEETRKNIRKFDTFIIKEKDRNDRNVEVFQIKRIGEKRG